MAEKDKDISQSFSFDTVAVLVATIMENGGNLGAKEFKRMSALDGTRGEHGFNHMFRKVKARAKELNEHAKSEGAGALTPVKKAKATGGGSAAKNKDEDAGTGTGKKRTRKSKKDEEGEDAEESPTKKVKAEAGEHDEADAPGEPNYEFEY